MIGDIKSILDDVKKQRIKIYHILSFPLDSARTEVEVGITGTYVYVMGLDGTASFRLNELSADSIDLIKNRQIIAPFYRFYLTNNAQSGKTLQIAIGVISEQFSIEDYSAPDLALMTGYTKDLRDNFVYNYGTQIAKSNIASNSTVVLHTVTAGKTLILEHYALEFDWTATGQSVLFFVTDASDTKQYDILVFYSQATSGNQTEANSLILSIPAGYKIKIQSMSATISIRAFIKGREI